jgi:predicted SprT family Zn-dependent metalloprotease
MSQLDDESRTAQRMRGIEIDDGQDPGQQAAPGHAAPTREQFHAYNRMFDFFNQRLFQGELPPVILNFSRHAGSYGFMAPERWRRRGTDGERTHEISINPTHLARRPLRETAATLVHEMCHLWQFVFGEPPRRGYHDREWAQKMLDVGLTPIDPKTGEPKMSAHALRHRIEPTGPFNGAFAELPGDYLLPWKCEEPKEGGRRRAAPSRNKVKYTCPGCKANVWGKPGLLLQCLQCDVDFVLAEQGE